MTGPFAGRAGGSDGGHSDEPEPVIRDKRRIDPVTGRVRAADTGPGAESPGGSAGPFPGAGRNSTPDPANPNDASQPMKVDLSAAELDLARQEAAERTADLQRITAEYANYRKRVDRDRESVVTAAKASVILELLTVLDDLDRARAHGDLVGSFGAVADRLTGALNKLGLERSGAVGDSFDPAVHEAVQFGTSTEVSEPTVTAIFRSGYTLGDRLVRPAVVVVTGPEHESESAAGAEASVDAESVDAESVGAESVGAESGEPPVEADPGVVGQPDAGAGPAGH